MCEYCFKEVENNIFGCAQAIIFPDMELLFKARNFGFVLLFGVFLLLAFNTDGADGRPRGGRRRTGARVSVGQDDDRGYAVRWSIGKTHGF